MYLTHPNLNLKNIIYGFLNKNIPGSTHRYIPRHENYIENKALACKIIEAKELAILDQQHTNHAIYVDNANSCIVADGQITKSSNLALGICTADCVPVLLADDEQKIIAAFHAGWKGARIDIAKNTIDKMKALNANKITAIIGPTIKQDNYEVSQEFYDNFLQETEENIKYFKEGKKIEHYFFDLTKYVVDKIKALDVENIIDMNIDTYPENNNFFSFRRTTHNPNSPMGHNLSFIMLK